MISVCETRNAARGYAQPRDQEPRSTAMAGSVWYILRLDRGPLEAPPQRQLVVEADLVLNRAVVPLQQVAKPPLVAIDIVGLLHDLEQGGEQRVAFLLGKPKDVR